MMAQLIDSDGAECEQFHESAIPLQDRPYLTEHQENNKLLGPLEVLESAGLTGVARSSFKIL